MRSEKKTLKQLKRKRILETILSLAILSAIFLGGLAGYYGSKIGSFLDGISTDAEMDDSNSIQVTQQIGDAEPFSALILGTDVEDGGASRSDTIIVATVNPKDESMKMVSVPRDTLITLPNGQIEKMNAAYATGGARLAREMVGEFLDIPIEFYATMDFRGLVELVDAVGGITVDSDREFTESNFMDSGNPVHIKKGKQKLDGAQALGYARMRKKDPRGDFGRQDRQREVIVEVLNELVSFKSITNLTKILNAIQPYLKTNATSSQMLGIAGNYSSVINNVEQLTLEGEAGTEYFPHYGLEVYIWEPFETSLVEVQTELRQHLELEEGPNSKINSFSEEELATPAEPETTNDY